MRRSVLAFAGLVSVSVPAPQRLSAQWTTSREAATEIARAWQTHDFAGLVRGARVEIRLPGVSAAGPVPAEQAVVLLSGYVRGVEEIGVDVVSVLEVSEFSGYAELRRRFRRGGVGDPVEETILVGLVRGRTGGGPDGGGPGAWRVEVVQAVVARGR